MTSEEYLELGLVYVREELWFQAIACFNEAEKGYKKDKHAVPPMLDSYIGLALAMNGEDLKEAQRRCRKGLDRASYEPSFYLNLGKVYLKAKDKGKAAQTFQIGLQLDKGHRGIRNEMKKLGMRGVPVLEFLPRNNFLNKYLGKIQRRLKTANSRK